ncbi:MAG TPA: hypothetical protein VJM11_21105 [Nevskiaceae bacterium]|nr:hypothetical protein [Nevskiaceae bacterium]
MTHRTGSLEEIRDDDVLAVRLLDRIARGDRVAMDHFYGIHESGIYRLALAILDDAQGATRVLVNVMLAVWHNAAELAAARKVRTALLALGLREARAWAAARGAAEPGPAVDLPASHEVEPDVLLDRVDDVLRVQAALHRLPPHHRATLHLAYCENLDHRGIARVMGCAPYAVAELQTRARRLLEQQLAA